MDIIFVKLAIEDAEKLFEFEVENREYFEQMVPSRGDGYYSYENHVKQHLTLLDEQELGLSYFYLIKESEG